MSRFGRWLNTLIRIGKGKEQGQVIISALVALVIGGLIIAPTLSHMSTGAKSTVIQQKATRELYAADAGVEHAIWKIIQGGIQLPYYESITVDNTSVNSTVDQVTEMAYGPIVTGDGVHNDFIEIYQTLVDNGGGYFTYTIHIEVAEECTPSVVHLSQIGAGLPDNFYYVNGSSSGVTDQDPKIIDGQMSWPYSGSFSSSYKPAKLEAGESTTQTFQMFGTGTPERYYSWVIANRTDIGIISTCDGYSIISEAGGTTINARVIKNMGMIYPVSWKIN